MKFAIFAALALAFTGVTLVSATDAAAACIPPNCPGFGRCEIREETIAIEESNTGASAGVPLLTVECYY